MLFLYQLVWLCRRCHLRGHLLDHMGMWNRRLRLKDWRPRLRLQLCLHSQPTLTLPVVNEDKTELHPVVDPIAVSADDTRSVGSKKSKHSSRSSKSGSSRTSARSFARSSGSGGSGFGNSYSTSRFSYETLQMAGLELA